MYRPQQTSFLGGYNGPPIPPQPPQRPPRTCFCCLLSTAIKLFIAACTALVIALLVLCLVFRPHRIKVAVDGAALTRFNLTTSPATSLSYYLATNFSLLNPNSRISVYYDWLEARSYYDGVLFGWEAQPSFYQGHKDTTALASVIQGSSSVEGLGSSGVERFIGESKAGVFGVDVWLLGRVRYKFGSAVTRRYNLRVKCELSVPLVSNNNSSTRAGFERKDCYVLGF